MQDRSRWWLATLVALGCACAEPAETGEPPAPPIGVGTGQSVGQTPSSTPTTPPPPAAGPVTPAAGSAAPAPTIAGQAPPGPFSGPGAPTPDSPAMQAPAEPPSAGPPGSDTGDDPMMTMPMPMPPADDGSGDQPPAAGSSGCGQAEVPEGGDKTIDVDGVEREYIVGVPDDYDPNHPYRLVFAWHGLGGSDSMIARSWYGMTGLADNSAIFIAGQGQGGSWVIHPDNSDVDFTRAMLTWAKESYCIDTERVFAVGMSRGGMMTNIVGCELGDEFRAIAAMSGGGPRGYATTPCVGQVAAWISHGNTDNNVPFSYGEMSRDYWLRQNGCDSESAPATPDVCVEFQGCDDGYPVQFCEFDGGHTIPSYSGEAAWNFFARF